MRIGYARVLSRPQELDRQVGALRAGPVDRLFAEKAPVKSANGRPRLGKAIDPLRAGDTLVAAAWDRVTGSMLDCTKIIERIHDG
jgi:DNA invertase Pin-like site-specific DNA recombinase